MGVIKVFTGLFTGDFGKMWEGIKQMFIGAVEFLWNLLNLMFIGRIFSGIKAFITGGINLFKAFWTTLSTSFKEAIDNLIMMFGYFRQTGSSIWQAFTSTIGNIISALRNAFKSHFQSIWDDAVSIFTKVKDAIINPIETARDAVKNAIDAIKGFFGNMKVKIPMPHFNVSTITKNIAGISVPVPNLDVDWYDKGGVFYGPQVIGVGEKRPEFVGALDDLREVVKASLREMGIGTSTNSYGDIYVTIDAKNIKEFMDIINLFNSLPQIIKQY